MRYLFIAIGYQLDRMIKLKSLKIFSYFPVLLGEYDLPGYLRKLGYTRKFNVSVIS